MTRVWDDADELEILGRFRETLRHHGYTRPRLKILPRLLIGAEEDRTHGYADYERVTSEMLDDYDTSQLICSHSRVVTDKGIYVCPILLDAKDARVSDSLADAFAPFEMRHGACYTCYQYGAICTNPSSNFAGQGG